MGRFKSPGQAQRFLSVHDQTTALLRPKRHCFSAARFRQTRSEAFGLWNKFTDGLAA